MSVKILSFINHAPQALDVEDSIERALEWGVDVIVAQGTSNDWGAYWLGSGLQANSANMKANLRPYLRAASERKIPFVLSVGQAGADIHVEESLSRVDELCREEGWNFDVGVISADIDPDFLRAELRAGTRIRAVHDVEGLSPYLTESDISESIRIVGLLGPEPIMDALAAGVDGVITGRAVDIALHMALPLLKGIPRGVAAHAGKILECGGIAGSNADASEPIWAEVDETGFVVRSPSASQSVTRRSVAAHSFYEREDPFREANPGGMLDLSECTYAETPDGGIRCEGARWIDEPYTVLIEGAKLLGYRSIVVFGIREPALLREVHALGDRVLDWLDSAPRFGAYEAGKDFRTKVRVFGHDGVLGPLEPAEGITGHEAAVIFDIVAVNQDLADHMAFVAFQHFFTGSYPGRRTTAGNATLPFVPANLPAGPVYGFSVYHILPLKNPSDPFTTRRVQLPGGGVKIP
jgi:Acyclic terpene utilisation family protein AtuA